MQPIWRGDTVYDETVLLFSQQGAAPTGHLLYRPTKVLAVQDYGRHVTYQEGKDFRVEGKKIIALPGADVLKASDSEVPKGKYPWFDIANRHVVVTYTHHDAWSGPTPHYVGEGLPGTMALLHGHKPLTVVVLGDSITLGLNVSGYLGKWPYMPTWPELFVRGLEQEFRCKGIKLYNTAVGGTTSAWGKEQATSAVASLDPDLVLIGFGMNDFWSTTPAEFRANVAATIAAVRKRRPHAEFILIASIKFDPAYTDEAPYVGNLAGYAGELRALEGPGIRVFDMTAMSDALYKAKSAKDLQTDPMHPADFLARWYAQGLVATLTPSVP
jgi:lysophospholipase L1-like esterase